MSVRLALAAALDPGGHHCDQFQSGTELVRALGRETYDLLLVDWNMPGKSGIEVVEWAKRHLESPPPIILVTSRNDKDDIASALNAGADDYIVKPESSIVIKARADAALRRFQSVRPSAQSTTLGAYVIDHSRKSISIDGNEVPLTGKEFALAELLFRNCDRPLSRQYIQQTVWNMVADLPSRTLDMHVSRVRKKLELRAENGFRLETVFGFGYRLEQLGRSP